MLQREPGMRVRRLCYVSVLVIGSAIGAGATPSLAQSVAKEADSAPRAALQPLDHVRFSIARLATVVETGQSQDEARRVVEEMFDFDEMARRTLAQHWKDGSPQEQVEFVRLFTALVEQICLMSLGNVPLRNMTFVSESLSSPYARVQSRVIVDGRSETAVEYRLVERDGRWAVYDVAVDGVGFVSSYRSQFNSILRSASFGELLERLNSRGATAARVSQ
jgi:phospholipid transport system substrate-binding protein